jgi:ATP-dependent Clp protease adaptor protein ClpS
MSSETSLPEVTVAAQPKSREERKTRRVPPYHVILENDDVHSFEFVVGVLRKALGYSEERAFQLMLQAHTSGRAVVWTGSKEVAEFKADQIRTFHETRAWDGVHLGPLGCTIEPVPGG